MIRQHEDDGFTACPEYQAAILGFYREHVCRLNPWPAGLERSFAEAGYQVYNTMNGPERVHRHRHAEDLGHHGPARRDHGARRCWSAGATTSARPATWPRCTSRIAGSQLEIIEDASHLCFAEQPAAFGAVLNDFLDRRDAAADANRRRQDLETGS